MHRVLLSSWICCALLVVVVDARQRSNWQNTEGNDPSREPSGRSNGGPRASRRKSDKPNIVFILTDDQDSELGSMNFMPKTQRLLRSGGAHFHNAFVTTPMCCPSRSSMLTGMYVHNHNTYTNNDNCSSVQWQRTHETRNFGTYLSNAGYRTGYFGKYLNEYTGTYIPPGWTEWVGLIRNTRFYNYSLNFNGKKIKHGDNYYKDYLTDLIANDSVTFLKQSKQYFPNRPVAMVLSMPAPHGPEDAAPQYQHMFPNITTHRTPSYNFAPNPDKQWILQYTGKMEPIHMEFTDMLHRKRLQTLQSVDDAVEKVFNELKELGELDNTYFIYSADHGYHLGQYGLVKGKAMPYDFDIRVPFLMRGPKIPPGVRMPNIVLNIDIAPTILDIAGVPTPDHMDGRSILKLFDGADDPSNLMGNDMKPKKAWRDSFLVERGKLTSKKMQVRDRLEAKHNKLSNTKEQRLEKECEKGEYQAPCSAKQAWQCTRDDTGKLRITKCRGQQQKQQKQNDVLPKRKTGCKCPPVDPLMARGEKRLQRNFLRTHVNQPVSAQKLKPKFIKSRRRRNVPLFDDGGTLNDSLPSIDEEYLLASSEEVDDLVSVGLPLGRPQEHVVREIEEAETPPYVNRGAVSCKVLPNGTISCRKPQVWSFDYWRAKKSHLDSMIAESKARLEKLKVLRKQLRQGKPELNTQVEDEGIVTAIDDDVQALFAEAAAAAGLSDKRLEKQRLKRKNRRNKKLQRKVRLDVSRDCNSPRMKCFAHDNQHWQTPPLWNSGPFCFCPNSNNNTYWCLRTINASHDFLYCEFITGFISYYDMLKDPYQLRNAVYDLTYTNLRQMQDQLEKLKSCRGNRECTVRTRPADGTAISSEGSGELQGESGEMDEGSGGSGEDHSLSPWIQEEGGASGDGEEEDDLKEDFLFLTRAFRLDDP
ncbi:hypothetical protein CAPTEDRAFT_174568 [Capitella teleta]|uniref:Sulfatase N-terminal domain-containing protein n=1 Tax=Capitella teleta TaxID=283909 RepID=R7VB78_CAPTE|nr:hypothetical protein CAPTEDRAFT_174568 [Capitella teleta]|eukprot:ELU16083.1 hypothetical protein CAPTEDRAFT_174568 [Capitella teleta]